jgi:hypothetical protein
MKFDLSDPIPLTPSEGFFLIRDEMTKLVPYLADTESIEVVKREDQEGIVKLVNKWQASSSKIPTALQSIIKKEMLSWLDHATWYENGLYGDWKLESTVGASYFSCSGKTSFKEKAGKTHLCMEINFEVYPEKVPGVPRLVAGMIRGQVEKFLGDLLTANMKTLAQSVQKYVENRG